VIISPEGFAITNAHVVQGETNLRTTIWLPQPDGSLKRMEIEDVELLAVNNQIDLALIRIKHPDGKPFLFAPVVREDGLEIGQGVFAIGNPLGLERTMTQGVVSTTSRNFDGLTYIQTDTAINPGNSGGPLFNTRGEVVGITNMGIRGGESLGFAIPARYVKDFIRNREAFAYDRNNPNSGNNYLQPPPRKDFRPPEQVKDASGNSR
jgi:serine protease Do